MISLCKDLIMKSLSFTFHAFLHGVQGQYCAWHPLQVLVGFVQTFSPFFNPKKCFSVMTVKEMSDWVMWFTGHWLGRKGHLESVRAQRREKAMSRSLEWYCVLPLLYGRPSVLTTKVARRYLLLTLVSTLWLGTFPSPAIIMQIDHHWNHLYVYTS